MKLTIIGMLIFIAGCKNLQPKNDLNGVYAVSSETEFGKMDDTLIVSKANKGEGIFQIARRAGVVKMLDGKEFPKEIVTETWTLEYDPVKQTLFELKGGKTLIWNGDNRTLQWGDRQFRQVVVKNN